MLSNRIDVLLDKIKCLQKKELLPVIIKETNNEGLVEMCTGWQEESCPSLPCMDTACIDCKRISENTVVIYDDIRE